MPVLLNPLYIFFVAYIQLGEQLFYAKTGKKWGGKWKINALPRGVAYLTRSYIYWTRVTQQHFISQQKVMSCNNINHYSAKFPSLHFSLILRCRQKFKWYLPIGKANVKYLRKRDLLSTVTGVNTTTPSDLK